MPRLEAIVLTIALFSGCQEQRIPEQAQPIPKTTGAEDVVVSAARESTVVSPAASEERLYTEPDTLVLPKRFARSQTNKNTIEWVEVGADQGMRSELHVYESYVVMTTPLKDSAGERVDVFNRPAVDGDTLVVSEGDSILLTIGWMGCWFEGIIGDYILIASQTGPGSAPLDIYDLTTGKFSCGAQVGEAEGWDGYLLTYWEPIDSVATPENCPESAEWTRYGLGAEFEEKVTLDIRSCSTKRWGEFRCVATQ